MADHFPLDWPQGYPRTKRRKKSRFDTSLANARDGLLDELHLMQATNVVISSNIETYERGGQRIPYANQGNPDDPGVAVYFQWRSDSHSLACDKWKRIESNMQALNKTVAAMRGLDRWGVSDMLRRTFSGFKALPEQASGRPWWEIIGVSPRASRAEIERAFRRRAKKTHPDRGGNLDEFHELRMAYEQGLQAAT